MEALTGEKIEKEKQRDAAAKLIGSRRLMGTRNNAPNHSVGLAFGAGSFSTF